MPRRGTLMLSRRHHNIFVYYRGPSAQRLGEADAHRQLEDNATKALINVLELGELTLTRSFAERFAPSTAPSWPADGRASFHLQGGPDGVPEGSRVLVGLSIEAELDPKAQAAAPDAGTRIDAAIVPPHGGLIAIETKVVELLDPHQLERHRNRWKIAPEDVVRVRWVDIWSWARDARAASDDPVTGFLLGQFCEFLEILGFGRWAGFLEEDFAQFTQWSWGHQPILRARMSAAWDRVLDLMPAEQAVWLGTVEAGKLPKGSTHAWAQTNRGQSGTNLTLELGAAELQFNLVGWNNTEARRLESWLLRRPRRAPDLELVVHERRAKPDHKGAPFWMHAGQTTLRTFDPAEVRSGAFGAWYDQWQTNADPTWTRLAYHLRHAWPRSEVLARGEDLAEEVAELTGQTIPLLREINRWSDPARGRSASVT